MRVVVQRCKYGSVSVDGKIINEIDNGMVLLVGFNVNDTLDDLEYIRRKVVNLRIYDDENGVMNKSIIDTKGKILSISQFTLYGDASKGRRPSYIKALGGDKATLLYDSFFVFLVLLP